MSIHTKLFVGGETISWWRFLRWRDDRKPNLQITIINKKNTCNILCQTLTEVSETPTMLHPVGLKQQYVMAEFVPPSRENSSCPDKESQT